MRRLLSHIFRFFVIAFAYLLAVFAATAFVMFLIWGGVTRVEPELSVPAGIAAGIGWSVAALLAARYAFFPMILVTALAEIRGSRSWLFHALSGMAVSLAALVLAANRHGFANPAPGVLMAVLAAGAVGGSVYWLISGRNSGRNLDRLAENVTSPPSGES
jgi:hypothetical protein